MNTIVEPNKSELVALCKSRGLKGYSNKNVAELKAMLASGAVICKSPLRYPGGKTRAIKILESYIDKYYSGAKTLLSPFFGGGSFELFMLSKGYKVYGNDLFTPLYSFWKQCGSGLPELVSAVRALMPVTKERFQQLRTSIGNLKTQLEIATAYYIINRCSFSGSTFCGGFSAEASTGRLNEASLKTLSEVKIDPITFSNLDYGAFLDLHPDGDDVVIYADPPYFIDSYIYGKDGDLHEAFDHVKFSNKIKSRKNWMLSYNNCTYIRDLYKDCIIIDASWSYGMNSTKASSEIIIFPS